MSIISRGSKKLKQTNWLYQNADESSVDDATKKAVEVVSSTTIALQRKSLKLMFLSFRHIAFGAWTKVHRTLQNVENPRACIGQ